MIKETVSGTPIFTAINPLIKQYPYLTEDIETDVIIVGGGVTGAIVAYYLSQQSIPCVVLEQNRIAHGSTSVTTSLLQYELDQNLCEITETVPLENAIRAYKLDIDALNALREFIEAHGNSCKYQARDTLFYTAKEKEIGQLQKEFELRQNNGLPVEWVDESSNPYSFDLKAGVIGKDGGAELDPYLYTHQLLDIAQTNGTQVFENTQVTCVKYENDSVQVECTYGHVVKGKYVVVATGYNTQRFTKRKFGEKTTTFNIATKPVTSFHGWSNHILIRDNNDPYHYLRTTPDNRIIIGGEDIPLLPEEISGKMAEEKYAILENHLKQMFPEIKDIQVEYKYCGAFATTPDDLGFVGPDPKHKRLWFCLGYGANGILFAISGARMFVDLYSGKANEDMELFSVDRFDS